MTSKESECFASVAFGVGQKGNDLVHLPERAGPAVQEHDGHGIFALPPLMDEMDANAIDLGAEVSELVDGLLLRPPVELILPVVAKLSHVVQVGAVVPASTCNLVRPAGAGEAVGEIVEDRLGDVDGEGLDHVL